MKKTLIVLLRVEIDELTEENLLYQAEVHGILPQQVPDVGLLDAREFSEMIADSLIDMPEMPCEIIGTSVLNCSFESQKAA